MNIFSTNQKIALAKAAYRIVAWWRRLRGQPLRDEFSRGGLRWQLDLQEGIDFSIYLLGSFEPEVVRCYRERLKPGFVAADLGANIGAHTLGLAKTVSPGGKVHAFEPTRYAFTKLNANLALNPELQPAVQARQLLLTESEEAVLPETIFSGWPLETQAELHAGHGGQAHSTEGAGRATLDQALADLTRLDFVKLDVDGHELAVLRGGRQVLARFRPPILIELCPQVCVEHGHTFADLVNELTGQGYGFQTIGGSALPNTADALERLIPKGGGINVLAVAASR